jgi:tetrahydromethanopterin S-methyltransferase subunit D
MKTLLPTLPDITREIIATVIAGILIAILVHFVPEIGKAMQTRTVPFSNSTP